MVGLLSELDYCGGCGSERTVTLTRTPELKKAVPKPPKKESRIKFFLFSVKWDWKNRDWDNTRQKYKRKMEDYEQYKQGKPCKYL